MQDDLILPIIDSQKIHDYLFSLLEDVENLENFCQCCHKLLSKYVKLDNFLIINNYLNDDDNIEIFYNYNANKDDKYLSDIKNLAQHQSKNKNNYLFLNFQDKNNNFNIHHSIKFKQNKLNFRYIITLEFKKQKLGYLIIDIETFKSWENQSNAIIKLVTKYLSLYIYKFSLEIKELELEKKEKKLLQTKENQSNYLSHMNHELRTPIAAVIGFAKMLQQQLYGELNPKQAQYVDAIHQSGKYLLDLVSDLLDISKIEAKKEDLYIEKILISELCKSSLALIKTKAEEQGLELKLKINSDIEYCYVDKLRIKQVLVNLLSNAVKFTENGSITLEVTQDNNYLKFNIIDTGIGINKESQEKLFKPFSQLNTHLHRQHRGTGLGLVISRELARLHGGDITLISEENKGSCFTLTLPLSSENF